MRKRPLSEFELKETLGVGTVGTIYRAFDRPNEREVALKQLHESVSREPLIRARFEREMLILEKLDHPHIVKYFGGGEDKGRWFFAMELLEAGSLKDLLERVGRLSWREAASIGAQVASALQHAHNHGVIHRDLKPGNLFLTPAGDIKLGDFGIARDTGEADITSHGLTVGTHAYMSPEQITTDQQVTGKTDLYALGCLLHELCTGQPPFSGENFAQLFEQHLRREPPPLRDRTPDCPDELENLVARLLSKDQELRPFNARAVQGELLRMLEETPLKEATEHDAGAGQVTDPGRALLKKRLLSLASEMERREVSWWTLGVMFALVGGIILLLLLNVLSE